MVRHFDGFVGTPAPLLHKCDLTSRAKATLAPLRARKAVHRHKLGTRHFLDNQLRDSITAVQGHGSFEIVVDQIDADLTSVSRIDGSWRISPCRHRCARTGHCGGCTKAAYPSGSAIAIPVRTSRRSPGASVTDSAAYRSAPASPGCDRASGFWIELFNQHLDVMRPPWWLSAHGLTSRCAHGAAPRRLARPPCISTSSGSSVVLEVLKARG